MADIAGISGSSGLEPTRSSPVQDPSEEELRAQQAAEVDASEAQPANSAPATNGTGTAAAADTDQSATAQGEREVVDQVSLSPEAQQVVQRQEVAADEFAPANDTNQDERDEDRTGVVNGNQNDQSQGTRALGQIVDQFA